MKWLLENGKTYAPIVTRLGVVAIFLYFGIFQMIKPAQFVGYLPSSLFSSPYAQQIVLANGIFETIFGVLLLLGYFTRLSAFLLGIHLAGITGHLALSFGLTSDIVWRDIALTIVTFSVVLYGPDKWCREYKKKKKKII